MNKRTGWLKMEKETEKISMLLLYKENIIERQRRWILEIKSCDVAFSMESDDEKPQSLEASMHHLIRDWSLGRVNKIKQNFFLT